MTINFLIIFIFSDSNVQFPPQLKIYADNSMKDGPNKTQLKSMEMSSRSKAVNGVMVSLPLSRIDSKSNSDATYGMKLFTYGYWTTFVIILLALFLLIVLLLKPLKEAFLVEKGIWSETKCIIVSFAYISFAINFVTCVAEAHTISQLGFHNNPYLILKLRFLLFLFVFCIVAPIIIVLCWRQLDFCTLDFLIFTSVLFTLTFLFSTTVLSFVPYLVLMFAYPVDTAALLTLHYTMIYTYTMLMAILLRLFSEKLFGGRKPTNDDQVQSLVDQFEGLKYAFCDRDAIATELCKQLLQDNAHVNSKLVTILVRRYVENVCNSMPAAIGEEKQVLKKKGVNRFTTAVVENCCKKEIENLANLIFCKLTEQLAELFVENLLKHLPWDSVAEVSRTKLLEESVNENGPTETIISQTAVSKIATCMKTACETATSISSRNFVEERTVCHFVDKLMEVLTQIELLIDHQLPLMAKSAKESLEAKLAQRQGSPVDFEYVAEHAAIQLVQHNKKHFSRMFLEEFVDRSSYTSNEALTKKLCRYLLSCEFKNVVDNSTYKFELSEEHKDAFETALTENADFKSFVEESVRFAKEISEEYKNGFLQKKATLQRISKCFEAKDFVSICYSICVLACSLPLILITYVFVMLMYLILVGRYNFSGDVEKAISLIVPSVLVGVSSRFLKQYIFKSHMPTKTKKD